MILFTATWECNQPANISLLCYCCDMEETAWQPRYFLYRRIPVRILACKYICKIVRKAWIFDKTGQAAGQM